MRVLATLARKELRDQRGLLLLAGGLFALVVVGARLALGAGFDAELRSQRILPFALGIVAAVLAAESIGRDASAGVESLWERLPVDRALVWGAKVLSAVAGAAVFLGGALLVELALRATERAPGPAGSVALLPGLWWLLLVPCATAAVLFWSALLRWSLAATLVGVGCVALPPLVWDQLSGRVARFVYLVWRNGPRPEWKWIVIAAAAGISGSLLAFRVRGWRRLPLRRVAAGIAGLLLVLGPTLARPLIVAIARLEFGLFHPEAELMHVEPSPDGRHLAVLVVRDSSAAPSGRVGPDFRAGILDRASGSWRDLGGSRTAMFAGRWPNETVWSPEGCMAVAREEDRHLVWELVDPRMDRAVWESSAEDGREQLTRRMGLESWHELTMEDDDYLLRWKARGKELRIPKRTWRWLVGAEPGFVFLEREGTFVRHDMDSGEERLVYRCSSSSSPGRLSPGDRWIELGDGIDRVIVEVASSQVLRREPGSVVHWCSEPGRVAVIRAGTHRRRDLRTILLLEDGSSKVLASGTGYWVEDGPDAFLRYGHRGHRLERLDLNGKVLEVLYPPDSPQP